jgi:hypothetical protein
MCGSDLHQYRPKSGGEGIGGLPVNPNRPSAATTPAASNRPAGRILPSPGWARGKTLSRL